MVLYEYMKQLLMRRRHICLNLQTFYLIKTGPLPNTLFLILSYFALFAVFVTFFFLSFSMSSCDNTPGLREQKEISTLSALLLHLGFVGVILFPLTSVPLRGHPIEPLSPPRPKSQVRENLKKSLYGKRRHLKESNRLEIFVPGMDRHAIGATYMEDITAAIYICSL